MYSLESTSFNLGVRTSVPLEYRSTILNEIKKIEKQNFNAEHYNYNLAGNIEHEYRLIDSYNIINKISIDAAKFFVKNNTVSTFVHSPFIKNMDSLESLELMDCWVNYQKKYEYNPLHRHGGIFSFVIWVQIPFELQEEINMFPNVPSSTVSKFAIYFLDPFGELTSTFFPIDKTWEWNMFLFPAKLQHAVYPFYTSNDFRISISGNLSIKI